MTISFTASGNDVLFVGAVHSTESSPEVASEKAAKLNAGFLRVIADGGVDADSGQFVPFGTKKGKTPTDTVNAAASGFKPFVKGGGKAKVDPDDDGDDDSSAATDTDHDYWTAGGKQKKALPGKPLPKK